ncbi:7086_t:CDS:2 [Cetraspora pellucida]|uniref:7086_t:CDS:1 n=1 Tax=Cetraspora pellucida TaxID=1433469 RepID=A0ACA9LES2_9GLOM|nr:7086_t:CDS:2 [Cetraspora pellucida]
MTGVFSDDLIEDFKKLYETKERFDTIIIVGEEPNVERIYAHSIILCTRSTYFRSALSDKWVERKDGYWILSKPNLNALTFEIILKFLYCGIVDFSNQKVETILEVLVAADEFLIQKLIDFVQSFFITNSYTYLQQSPIKMVHFIIHNNQFNELKEAYLEAICRNPHLLFDSGEFLLLEEDALKLILKCDNLDMKEHVIWKKLVEWGIAQNTVLEDTKSDGMMSVDTKNNDMMYEDTKNNGTMCEDTKSDGMMCEDKENDAINILKETLGELIKLIRFYQMDHKEFIPEVWEYMSILPKDLVKDVLRCYLDSDVKPFYEPFLIRWGNFKIDSILINKEIALLLMKWIDKKSIDDKNIKGFKYKFNLLFRSSLDGFSSQVFHRKCDNKGATFIIAKIKDSKFLIGGYNPLDWVGKNLWKRTTSSFLFAFDPNEHKNAVVSRVNRNDSGNAIYCNDSEGPIFGEGPDLCIPNDNSIFLCQAN